MFVVVGAGIAGLAAALALADHGEVTVLERRAEAAANAGAGIQISPNAVKALTVLGAADDVAARARTPSALHVRVPQSSDPIVRLPYGAAIAERFGAPYLTASRAGLHTGLMEAVNRRGIVIRYDRPLRSLTHAPDQCRVPGVDGAARLVIAADGINSQTRRVVVGDAPRPSGWIAWRGMGEPSGEATELIMGAGHHLVRYTLGADDANCVLVAKEASRGPAGIARTATGPLIADVSQWAPWPIATRPRHVFASGRVGFIGDAAHAMLPFLAQGAAMALEDAAALKRALDSLGPTPAALQLYAAERRPRTRRVAAMSEQQGTIYHLPFPLDRARNIAMRRLGPAALVQRIEPIYAWTPNAA